MPIQETYPGGFAPEAARGPPPRGTDGEGKNGGSAGNAARAPKAEQSFAPRMGMADSDERAGRPETQDTAVTTTDEFKQAFGDWTRYGEDMVRGSQQRLQALADCNCVVVRGVLEGFRAWNELAQARVQRRVDGFAAIARCRTPDEAWTVQERLWRDNLEQTVDTSRRLAQLSLDVLQGAADTLQPNDQTGPAAAA